LQFHPFSKELQFMKISGVYSLTIAAGCVVALINASPVLAQQSQGGGPRIRKDSLEHTNWHTAPREFQIIDDRPVIKDFREAPQQAGTIELPPGPSGSGGSGGGGGGGALGGGPGSLPGGGLALPGNGGPGYRTDTPGGMGSLPKSGFGRESNIPARGMGPRGNLPGVTQGVIGKMVNQQQAKGSGAGAPKGISAPTVARTNGNSSTPVASYSGGYGTGSGPAFGGSASQTSTSVRGSLLRK
jgi:hypothetical protein